MKLSSWVRNTARGKVGTVAAVAAIAAIAGTGASVAAGQITSAQIKDGTIQTGDLTKNNFARFTATEKVVNAATPVSTDPSFAGNRVVAVPANTQTGLATLVLDKGTWQINGVAQFWHIGPAPVAAPDYGVVTIPGFQDGFGTNFSADVPDGGSERRPDGVPRHHQDHRQRHADRDHRLLHGRQHGSGRRDGLGHPVRLREAVQERAADLTWG